MFTAKFIALKMRCTLDTFELSPLSQVPRRVQFARQNTRRTVDRQSLCERAENPDPLYFDTSHDCLRGTVNQKLVRVL
jgi:hypothetical protein